MGRCDTGRQCSLTAVASPCDLGEISSKANNNLSEGLHANFQLSFTAEMYASAYPC